ncbi:hypothetical protein ABG067_005377 [Albugo candida]
MDHILKENISSIELKYGNIERKSRYLSHVLMRPPIPPQEDALYVRKSSESDLKMEATNDMEAMSPSSDVCKNSQIGDFLDVKNEDDTEMVLNTTYESGAKADTIFAGTEVSYLLIDDWTIDYAHIMSIGGAISQMVFELAKHLSKIAYSQLRFSEFEP